MQNSARSWDSAGLGIIAFATALGVATAAGIFAVREFDDSLPEMTTVLATVLATISLVAYLFVVLFGLAALLRDFQIAQKNEIVRAVRAVFLQAYTAVLAAGIVMYFPLLERLL